MDMSNDDGMSLINYLNKINIGEIYKVVNEAANEEIKGFVREGGERILDQFRLALALVCDNAAGMGYGISNGIKIVKLTDEAKVAEETGKIEEVVGDQEKVKEIVSEYLQGKEAVTLNITAKLFHGSGHSGKTESNSILTSFYVVWAIGIDSTNYEQIKTVLAQVIIGFLDKCFLDPQEIVELGNSNSPKEKFQEYIDRVNYDIKKAYIKQIEKKCGVDIDRCTDISLYPYEKRACYGRMLFLSADEVDSLEGTVVRFREEDAKRELKEIQGTRKFLEACGDGVLLVEREKHHLLGMAILNPEKIQKYPYVKFNGTAKWELIIQNRTVLCYEMGRYYANREEKTQNCKIQLEGLEIKNFEELEKVFKVLENTSHGAIVIMAKDAEKEAKRLARAGRATSILPFMINENAGYNLLKGLLNVDGAVLINHELRCYAFGTILDGEARTKGKEKRGARYNSSRNYVAGTDRVAFVISEDKTNGIEIIDGRKVELLIAENEQ